MLGHLPIYGILLCGNGCRRDPPYPPQPGPRRMRGKHLCGARAGEPRSREILRQCVATAKR